MSFSRTSQAGTGASRSISPPLQGLEALELTTSVTFLVGENGSGKSTFLEALAAATGLPTVGSQSANRDPTLGPQRRLGKAMRLSWRKKIHCGFFLRAEDFFGFAKRLAEMRKEFQDDLVRIDEEFKDHSEPRSHAGSWTSLGLHRRHGAAVRRRPGRQLARGGVSEALPGSVRPRRTLPPGRAQKRRCHRRASWLSWP